MIPTSFLKLAVTWFFLLTPSHAAVVCKAAAEACTRHKDCCGMLMCSPKRECRSPGKYAIAWLKASTSRRTTYYTNNNKNVALAPMKWSYTLAEAAQNWTNTLIQQDDCKNIADAKAKATCYSFDNVFSTYCKLIHEGNGLGSPNPYGGENLAAAIAGPSSIGSYSTPEKIMQGWWDDEEADKGGHFFAAAKMSSRYMGCGWSQMTTPEGYVCRITACRYMAKCGDLFEPRPTWCPMCPREGC